MPSSFFTLLYETLSTSVWYHDQQITLTSMKLTFTSNLMDRRDPVPLTIIKFFQCAACSLLSEVCVPQIRTCFCRRASCLQCYSRPRGWVLASVTRPGTNHQVLLYICPSCQIISITQREYDLIMFIRRMFPALWDLFSKNFLIMIVYDQ